LTSCRSIELPATGIVVAMTMMHAFDLLSGSTLQVPDVVALFGSDATLRSWVLHALMQDGDSMQVEGANIKWADLKDELSTASLFDFGDSQSKRAIVIRSADAFLKDHRESLEKYVADPGSASRLVLECDSLPSNTKLYKALAKDQLLVDCFGEVDAKRGLTRAKRLQFLCDYIAPRYQCKLTQGAADALVELIGESIGMLDTEIGKLALYLDPGGTVNESLVREVVTGWQAKTMWKITDSIAAGDAPEAIRQLEKLMSGGQPPIALFPQLAWSLRRFGLATAVIEHAERIGRPIQPKQALSSLGTKPFELAKASDQLVSIRRDRGRQLLAWLLDADLRLKGTHSSDGRDAFLLEHLVIKLAKGAQH
jgi:DNA polymerase-3 subunit delta